jgi:hypothetical protein
MKTIKRNIPMTIAAFVALAAMAVAAVAQGGGTPPGEGVTQVTAIEQQAHEAMDVLDTPRGQGDALPSEVADSLDEHAKFGMNPDLSRSAIDTAANDVHVVPADDHVCTTLTIGDGASISCPATEDVASGDVGPTVVTLEGGAIGIYGIVPDGISSVTVETGESDSDVVEVTANAYFTALPEGTPLRTLSYTGPSGVVEFTLHDPAVVFEEE